MTKPIFGPEVKPWEPPFDERLNPNSFAATAVFGIVELATETLWETSEGKITATDIKGLSKELAQIVIDIQVELGEGGGWNAGLNARLRGALRTAIKISAGNTSDHDRWLMLVGGRTRAIAIIARDLHEETK